MKLLIQRVSSASVDIGGSHVAEIGPGLLVLVGFGRQDSSGILPKAIDKLVNLRVFADARGRFQYSLLEQRKSVLAVPQFTLYGNTDSGRRPDFLPAMAPKMAEPLFGRFCELLGKQVLAEAEFGVFGAHMEVALVNDGPVTLMIEL